jgi:ribonucleoside-diphosphate reductase alpha chain
MNLQYGVPLEILCDKLSHSRFEPMGMTTNKEIPMVKSIMDYLGRWLALKFLTREKAKKFHNVDLVDQAYATGTKSKEAFAMRLPVVDEGMPAQMNLMNEPVLATVKVITDEPETLSADDAREKAKLQGYTGSMCSGCGSSRMKRNGSCELCMDCGVTSGCS